MKPEQLLWQLVKPYIPGHYNRVENAAGVGMPDVNFCHEGRESWLELKVARGGHKDPLSLLEPEQIIWHMKRVHEQGRVYVMVRDSNWLTLFKATYGSRVQCNYAQVWRGQKPWVWDELQDILKHL